MKKLLLGVSFFACGFGCVSESEGAYYYPQGSGYPNQQQQYNQPGRGMYSGGQMRGVSQGRGGSGSVAQLRSLFDGGTQPQNVSQRGGNRGGTVNSHVGTYGERTTNQGSNFGRSSQQPYVQSSYSSVQPQSQGNRISAYPAASRGNNIGYSPLPIAEPELEQLKKEILDVQAVTQEFLHRETGDATRVLLVGTTGAGKSTFLHALAGIPLNCVRSVCGPVLEPIEEIAAIGHSAVSMTSIPNMFVDKNNGLSYFDCPGFFDTSVAQRVVNAFAIDQLFSKPCKVKVLIVMNVAEMKAVERGAKAKEVFRLVSQLLPDIRDLEQSIGLVVTNTNEYFNADEFFYFLNSGDSTQAKAWGSPATVCEPNPVLRYFSNEGREKVFEFPSAGSNLGPYTLFSQDDRDRVITSLKKSPVINPQHNIVIDEKAQLWIYSVEQSFNKEIINNLSSLTNEISAAFRHALQLSSIENWIRDVKSLNAASQNGLKSFVECANTLNVSSSFSSQVKKIEDIVPWYEFVSSIKASAPESNDLITFLNQRFEMQLNELESLRILRQDSEKREADLKRERDEIKKQFDAKLISLEEKNRKLSQNAQEDRENAKKFQSQLAELEQNSTIAARAADEKIEAIRKENEDLLRKLRASSCPDPSEPPSILDGDEGILTLLGYGVGYVADRALEAVSGWFNKRWF